MDKTLRGLFLFWEKSEARPCGGLIRSPFLSLIPDFTSFETPLPASFVAGFFRQKIAGQIEPYKDKRCDYVVLARTHLTCCGYAAKTRKRQTQSGNNLSKLNKNLCIKKGGELKENPQAQNLKQQ